jgi:hypothetical protein
LLLIVAAVAGFFVTRSRKQNLRVIIGAERLSIAQLEQLRGVSDELGAQSGFRKVDEVVGAAHHSPAVTLGTKKAPGANPAAFS